MRRFVNSSIRQFVDSARENRMRRFAKALLAGVLAVGVMAGFLAAWGYEPPRIIGVLNGPQENPDNFAADFCCIGDQNGDGCDDLLISQYHSPTQVYIYEGGDTIPDQPAFTYTSYEEGLLIGSNILYLGHFSDHNGTTLIAFNSLLPRASFRIDLYECLPEPDNLPSYTFFIDEIGKAPLLNEGWRNRPIDFNGDGFNDIIVMKASVGFQVYYGGEEWDTIPDWSRYLYTPHWWSGRDVNGDGCGDIIIFTKEGAGGYDIWYSLYLGGAEPDTIPDVRILSKDYDLSPNQFPYFAMLPDINGDGCDEWGAYWNHIRVDPEDPRPEDAGFYIWMGSEEPDGEPDLMLAETPDPWYCRGPLAGGDFNGDGYGDIVVKTGGSDEDHGQDTELQFHFGSPWITDVEGERQPDLFVDLGREYDGVYAHELYGFLGAVGDYNGDGADDFVYGGIGEFDRAVIFAGDRDWQGSAPQERELPQAFSFTLSALPNPFNDQVRLTYTISHSSRIVLALYDIQGRAVKQLCKGLRQAGTYSVSAEELNSGIYFAVLVTDYGRAVKKIVCLK